MPPCVHCGALVEPCLARPVPFCLHGFLPPPETSERVRADCVPCLWFARYALTISFMTETFGSIPKTPSASSIFSTSLPAMFKTATVGILYSSFPYAFTLSRRTTVPPFGPGIAPLTAMRLFSASTLTTARFWTVTFSAPR